MYYQTRHHEGVCYDSWEFLREVLTGLGFPDLFIKWVFLGVCSPKFSIQINGSPEGYFEGIRGLRQGDLISPALFVLGMKYFSRMMRHLTREKDFRYHPKYRQIKLTHLLFANDVLIFARGDRPSVRLVKQLLDTFAATSGLKISAEKYSLFLGGVNELNTIAICSSLQM